MPIACRRPSIPAATNPEVVWGPHIDRTRSIYPLLHAHSVSLVPRRGRAQCRLRATGVQECLAALAAKQLTRSLLVLVCGVALVWL